LAELTATSGDVLERAVSALDAAAQRRFPHPPFLNRGTGSWRSFTRAQSR
jgi:hypothetical protein